jgi:WD40 repeat protein
MRPVLLMLLLALSFSAASAQDLIPEPVEIAHYGEGRLSTQQHPSGWSPDGTRLAVRGSRGSWVFDMTDPDAAPGFVPRGPAESLLYAVYTPDGRYAVDHEGRTRVFNADGSLLWEADGDDPAWSADGTLVALRTEADVFVVDAGTGDIRHERSFADAAAEVVLWTQDVTFIGDPALLFVETTDGWYSDTVVWDIRANIVMTMPEFLDMPALNKMTLIAAAPDGVTMVFAQTGGNTSYDILYVLNLDTREILEVSGDYTLPSTDGTFSPDGSLFAMRNTYGDTHFWHVSEAGWTYQTGLATGGVPSFSPDGRFIALEDYVYELETAAQIIDFDRVVTRFTASPDGEHAFDGKGSLFNVLTGETIAALDISVPPSGAQYSPDGSRLATWHDADGFSTLYLWDAHTGSLQAEIARAEESPSHPLNFAPLMLDQPATFRVNWKLTFSPDSSLLHIRITSSAGADEQIVWDVLDDRRLPIGKLVNARLLEFTRDNRLFMVDDIAWNNHRYYLWDPRSSSPTEILQRTQYGYIILSADTRLIASIEDEDIEIFDVAAKRNLARAAVPNAEHMYAIIESRFSEDNTQVIYTTIASEVDSGTEYVFDIASQTYVDPPEPTALSFIATSDRYGVVGSGRSMLIYALDAEMGDAPLAEITPLAGVPETLFFSPDGTHLVGNYGDIVIIVWQLH